LKKKDEEENRISWLFLVFLFKCIPIANGFGDGVKIHIIQGVRKGDSQKPRKRNQ